MRGAQLVIGAVETRSDIRGDQGFMTDSATFVTHATFPSTSKMAAVSQIDWPRCLSKGRPA
jgi:hypothetical protein